MILSQALNFTALFSLLMCFFESINNYKCSHLISKIPKNVNNTEKEHSQIAGFLWRYGKLFASKAIFYRTIVVITGRLIG
jgi:hypothetical protein